MRLREREVQEREVERVETLQIIVGGKIRRIIEPPFTRERILPIVKEVLKELGMGRNFTLVHNGKTVPKNFQVLERGGRLVVRGVDLAGSQ